MPDVQERKEIKFQGRISFSGLGRSFAWKHVAVLGLIAIVLCVVLVAVLHEKKFNPLDWIRFSQPATTPDTQAQWALIKLQLREMQKRDAQLEEQKRSLADQNRRIEEQARQLQEKDTRLNELQRQIDNGVVRHESWAKKPKAPETPKNIAVQYRPKPLIIVARFPRELPGITAYSGGPDGTSCLETRTHMVCQVPTLEQDSKALQALTEAMTSNPSAVHESKSAFVQFWASISSRSVSRGSRKITPPHPHRMADANEPARALRMPAPRCEARAGILPI